MLELFVIFEILTVVSIWILIHLYADLKIEHNEELERYKKAIAIEKHYFKKLDELNRDILCKWGDTLESNTELIEQNKKIFKHNEDLLMFNNILSTAITEGKAVYFKEMIKAAEEQNE